MGSALKNAVWIGKVVEVSRYQPSPLHYGDDDPIPLLQRKSRSHSSPPQVFTLGSVRIHVSFPRLEDACGAGVVAVIVGVLVFICIFASRSRQLQRKGAAAAHGIAIVFGRHKLVPAPVGYVELHFIQRYLHFAFVDTTSGSGSIKKRHQKHFVHVLHSDAEMLIPGWIGLPWHVSADLLCGPTRHLAVHLALLQILPELPTFA
mmetsp:Transcript_44904/g.73171  ORF Transcript_44904/g.73171 Transcript_44904/m.73171 type:complete len:204 (-) Transcript_44904:2125-2736(-)